MCLLDGERIAKVGAEYFAHEGAEIFDAKGLFVAPGFIDLHCHLREPGQELSETIETGTRGGGARRIHGGVLHAEHAAGE